MQVVVCALAKNEHNYINQFVNHYVKLGFDKIYIYDNDDEDKPYIGDFIDESLLNKVEIIDIRGMRGKEMQHIIYTKFYKEHKFDWALFCDIDEYLVGINEIHEFLDQPKYKFVSQIRIKWRLFGDDGLIERDMSKTLMESFTKEITYSLTRDLNHIADLQSQAKCLVRGGIEHALFVSVHYANVYNGETIIPSVLPSCKPCLSKVTLKEKYNNETVYLNHYMTKTLSEFIEQKLNRNDAVFDKKIELNYYWRINEKTKEKLEYLKKKGII